MSKQATESSSELTLNSSFKGGFFERALLSKLSEISSGTLMVQTPSKAHAFGQGEGSQAELLVKNKDFFRKACLGGSLGVADSYAAGDWTTNDLVLLFRSSY